MSKKGKKADEKNASTEEKIKAAARAVFMRKGFAATRTRDIAEESGYNLALINYYFRSKEKLFDIIMFEQLQVFVNSITGILNDPSTSLPQKIETLVAHYIDMLTANPNLPIFILSEISAGPEELLAKIDIPDRDNLYLLKQWQELVASGRASKVNPIHMLINLVSLTVFPFVASPLLRRKTGISIEQFNALMEERKKLIPAWIGAILSTPDSEQPQRP